MLPKLGERDVSEAFALHRDDPITFTDLSLLPHLPVRETDLFTSRAYGSIAAGGRPSSDNDLDWVIEFRRTGSQRNAGRKRGKQKTGEVGESLCQFTI